MRSEDHPSPVPSHPVDEYLDVVRFQAGGFRFAVEASQVNALCADRPTKESGISVNLLEDLIGLPGRETPCSKWLVIGSGGKDIFVGVLDPIRLEALQSSIIFPLPALVAARISIAGIRAMALDQDGPVFLLDLQALCAGIDH